MTKEEWHQLFGDMGADTREFVLLREAGLQAQIDGLRAHVVELERALREFRDGRSSQSR